jgi:hypothetical protein
VAAAPGALVTVAAAAAVDPCLPHQALSSRDMTTFLLRAPPGLISSCTQAQALQVLGFLKRDLGVKQEYLFPRIVCAAPGVLLQVGHACCGGWTVAAEYKTPVVVWGRNSSTRGMLQCKLHHAGGRLVCSRNYNVSQHTAPLCCVELWQQPDLLTAGYNCCYCCCHRMWSRSCSPSWTT